MKMKTNKLIVLLLIVTGVGAFFCTISKTVFADIVVDYRVNIVQDGPVLVGSTLDWEIHATVTGSDATNFGIATAAIDIQDSFFEPLNPGSVKTGLSEPFEGYAFPSGGTFNHVSGKLENIGALQFMQSASTVGADSSHGGSLGPFLLATGSYTVNFAGIHTLSAVPSGSLSRYFSASGQALGDSLVYDDVTFGSDSILVNAVPEPSGSVLAIGGLLLLIRRRRRCRNGFARSDNGKSC